jgi:hypothetical protein
VALALVTALSVSTAAVAAPSCPIVGDESAKPDSGRRAVAGPAVGRDSTAARGRGNSARVRCPTGGPNTWTTLVPETSSQGCPLLPFLRGDRGFGVSSSVKKN